MGWVGKGALAPCPPSLFQHAKQGAHKGRPYAMSFFVGATLVVALHQQTPVRFIHQGRLSGRYRTRNDGYDFAISPHEPREFCFEFPPLKHQRAWGDAGRPMRRSLACEVVVNKCTRVFTAVAPEITRHPRTQWFYGLYALSPVSHALLPPSPCGLKVLSNPVGPNEPPQALTPASGASGPHDFAVRVLSCQSRLRGLPRRSPGEGGEKNSAVILRAWYRSRRAIRPATHSKRLTLPRPPHLIPRP